MSIRRYIQIVENAESAPYINAHRSGSTMWIDMMAVPEAQRGKGIGRAYYEQWEASLPKDIQLVRLMAADSGSGLSNGFWEAVGFDYQYSGENLDYETSQYMWKGVNGHPTPITVDVDEEDLDEAVDYADLGQGKVRVFRNPSAEQLAALVKKHQRVRGIEHGGDLWFWNSYDATHFQIAATFDILKDRAEFAIQFHPGHDLAPIVWLFADRGTPLEQSESFRRTMAKLPPDWEFRR